jgi:hypothetical protein
VLDDLGWEGYLGFVEEGRDSLHIGCAPSVRDFFANIFQDAFETEARLGTPTDPAQASAGR